MPDPNRPAAVRAAAIHAADYLERISNCLSLLSSEITRRPWPSPAEVQKWVEQADWLRGLLKGESESLRNALT